MARTTNIISIPRPPASAFNKNRPAGTLLQAQAVHLRESLIQHLAEVVEVLAIPLSEIRTEGEVSAYAHRVTDILHPRGAKRAGN
ncbi:MAG: hypothetical protein ABSF92_06755 [Candidatus Acidiferrales bacterium]|jgi:hypothetical protein